jgi:hypothetical protein
MDYELLKSLQTEDIKNLIADISLLESGYQIYYAIDNYDLVEYCFPLGIDGSKTEKSIDIIGDEQFAYRFFFEKFKKKIWLPREYIAEVINERNQVIDKAGELANIKGVLEDRFIMPIIKSKDEGKRKILLARFKNQISFSLSFSLMTPNSVKKFHELLQQDLKYNVEDFIGDTDINETDEIIDRSKVNEAFDEWIADQKSDSESQLKKYNNKSLNEAVNFLESIYRDITVIFKLINVNKRLDEKNVKKIILFHSSTPKRSQHFFKLNSISKSLPLINNVQYQLLRNKAQSYLLSLIWNEGSGTDYAVIKERLEQLMTIAEKYEDSETRRRQIVKTFELDKNLFQEINQHLRTDLENSFLISRIKEVRSYQQSIYGQIEFYEKTNGRDFLSIINVYKDILRIVEQYIPEIKNTLAEETLASNYLIQESIFNVLINLDKDKTIVVKKGKDAVRGTFHHLPFLLFYDQNFISAKSKELLYPLLDYCFLSGKRRDVGLKHFKKYIQNYSNYFGDGKTPDWSLNIISILILLLIPQEVESETQETGVLERVEVFLELFERVKKTEINSLKDVDFERELLYLKVWILRRERLFSDAEKVCEMAIDRYPADPRFYHGLSLIYYSRAFINNADSDTSFRTEKEINQIIELAIRSVSMYEKSVSSNEFVGFTIIALNNMLAHLYTEYYKLSGRKDSNYLQKADEQLKRLIDFLLTRGKNYEEYPEFLQTKANMQLEQSIYYWEEKKFSNALSLIYVAEDLIEMAVKMVEADNPLYKRTQLRIRQKKNEFVKLAKEQNLV